jgi:hypothetical protein
MGWFSKKRDQEIAELRKQIQALAQHVAGQTQAHGFDAGKFLEQLMDGQVKQVDTMTGFIRMISDVATERMASALGRRGGRKRAATAARDSRGRMLPGSVRRVGQSDCVLCSDPTTANFSMEDFGEHQKHKNRPRQEAIRPTPEEAEVIEREPLEVRAQPQYPLPVVERDVTQGNTNFRASGGAEAEHSHGAGTSNGRIQGEVS